MPAISRDKITPGQRGAYDGQRALRLIEDWREREASVRAGKARPITTKAERDAWVVGMIKKKYPRSKNRKKYSAEQVKKWKHDFYVNHRGEILAQQAEYRKTHKEEIKARVADWRTRNKEKDKATRKRWHDNNIEKVRKSSREYARRKYAERKQNAQDERRSHKSNKLVRRVRSNPEHERSSVTRV